MPVDAARTILRDLRRAGVRADLDHRQGRLRSQLRRADHSGADFTVIIGGDELERNVATVRDMVLGLQDEVALPALADHLRARREASRFAPCAPDGGPDED